MLRLRLPAYTTPQRGKQQVAFGVWSFFKAALSYDDTKQSDWYSTGAAITATARGDQVKGFCLVLRHPWVPLGYRLTPQ